MTENVWLSKNSYYSELCTQSQFNHAVIVQSYKAVCVNLTPNRKTLSSLLFLCLLTVLSVPHHCGRGEEEEVDGYEVRRSALLTPTRSRRWGACFLASDVNAMQYLIWTHSKAVKISLLNYCNRSVLGGEKNVARSITSAPWSDMESLNNKLNIRVDHGFCLTFVFSLRREYVYINVAGPCGLNPRFEMIPRTQPYLLNNQMFGWVALKTCCC